MIGLSVMRLQPLHLGHHRLIKKMLEECDRIIIAIGSVQEYGTKRNPFTFSQRKKMIKNCFIDYWHRIEVLGIKDINNEMLWPKYVLDTVLKETALNVEKYYGGSEYDCHWFSQIPQTVYDRNNQEHPFISGTMIRDMISYGDKRWRDYVPECIWDIVEKREKLEFEYSIPINPYPYI